MPRLDEEGLDVRTSPSASEALSTLLPGLTVPGFQKARVDITSTCRRVVVVSSQVTCARKPRPNERVVALSARASPTEQRPSHRIQSGIYCAVLQARCPHSKPPTLSLSSFSEAPEQAKAHNAENLSRTVDFVTFPVRSLPNPPCGLTRL